MHCLLRIVFVCQRSLAQLSSWRWGNDDIDILGRCRCDKASAVSGLPNDRGIFYLFLLNFQYKVPPVHCRKQLSSVLWHQTPASALMETSSVNFFCLFYLSWSAELLWWLVVGNPNAPDRFWLLSFCYCKGNYAANDANLKYDWPNPTRNTYISPPFSCSKCLQILSHLWHRSPSEDGVSFQTFHFRGRNQESHPGP